MTTDRSTDRGGMPLPSAPRPDAAGGPAPPVAAAPQTPAAPQRPLGLAILYVASGYFMFIAQGLGMNIVTANLYQLQGTFSATIAEVAALSAAYMAPYATFSLALFKIRVQYGLRPFAELSIIAFALASCLNLFVTDLHAALVIRFVSGMAAAPLSSLGFLYILEAFPPQRKLSVGLSLALIGTLLAAPLSRIVSPVLLDLDGWRALYAMELGLALMALPIIYLLPLTAPPRAKAIERTDVLSYFLLALGLGGLAVFFTLGRFYWWLEADWLGMLLAASLAALTLFAAIELPRKNPMLDLRWIFSGPNLHMAGVLILFRAITSEQSSTTVSFFQQLGIQNDQTVTFYLIVLAASIAGGLVCTALMASRFVETAHVAALALIAAGAFMDSGATSLTRPEQMYGSQAMIAMGAAMFLPPVMARGFASAMSRGAPYLVNFITIFLFTQITGSVVTTAALGSFVTLREKFHSAVLVESVLLTNPVVADRVRQLAGAYGRVLTDPTLLSAEGLALLSQQVQREAYLLAYDDTFFVIGCVAAIALVLLLVHLAWLRLAPLWRRAAAGQASTIE